jgi:hypothetical protein
VQFLSFLRIVSVTIAWGTLVIETNNDHTIAIRFLRFPELAQRTPHRLNNLAL